MLARIVAFALFAVLVPGLASADAYRTYGNWSVICDNRRTCTAIGYAPENESNAFIKITRSGRADAAPSVELAVEIDGPSRDRKLDAIVHGGSSGRIPVGPLNATSDGAYAHAIIPPPISYIWISALREASSVSIRLVDRPTPNEHGSVSLDGSAAALLSMDDQQHRVHTRTALASHGNRPLSTIPAPPAAPLLRPMRITALPTPPSPGPSLVANVDPICGSAPEMWMSVSGRTIRGVCTEGGAYNIVYRYFFVGPNGATPVPFHVPAGLAPSGDVLVNPSLSSDGLILSQFSKGIGLGTCGIAQDWMWTGNGFTLFRSAEMRDCRGVISPDWPVEYQAKMRKP
jgi:hypothetical protein